MKKINLAENYERLFGYKLTDEVPEPKAYQLTEANVQIWNRLQNTLMTQYNNKAILQVLGNNVYVNGKLVEAAEKFFQRSSNGMLTLVRSKLNG